MYSIILKTKKIDIRALCGILNSDLIQYFYIKEFKSKTDIFPKIRIGQVKKIPICVTNDVVLQKISNIVSEIQSTKKFLININTKIREVLLKDENLPYKKFKLIELLNERDMCIVKTIDLEEDINNLVYQLYNINETELSIIKEELKIKNYNIDLENLVSMLNIEEFLNVIKKYNLYEIGDMYNCNIKTIVQLRDKYKEIYNDKSKWDFYYTEEIFETINIIINDIVEDIFMDTEVYAYIGDIINTIGDYLINFNQLIDIIRLEKYNIKTIDVIRGALSLDIYTWNAYRKAKESDKINKTFIKYYDSNYYGLAEWSDEIHKQYFMNAIEEYTVTNPNEKKAKDILKLFKDLDIMDKQDYIEIIESKINRAFK